MTRLFSQQQRQLTKNYAKAIAEYRDTSFTCSPTLYVAAKPAPDWIDQYFTGFSDGEPPPVQCTHLRLMDGDGNQLLGRLSTELAAKGAELKRGDIIRLDLFTELTHRINANKNPMRTVYILKYSPISYSGVPPVVDEVQNPISCGTSLPCTSWAPTKQSTETDRSEHQ